MTFLNNLDPDEAPQNVGLHLRSKLFDIQIIYQQKKWVETMNILKIFERNKYLKKLPSMQRVKVHLDQRIALKKFHSTVKNSES